MLPEDEAPAEIMQVASMLVVKLDDKFPSPSSQWQLVFSYNVSQEHQN